MFDIKNKTLIIVFAAMVIIGVLLLSLLFWQNSRPIELDVQEKLRQNAAVPMTSKQTHPQYGVIMISKNRIQPATLTVKSGTSVEIHNFSDALIDIQSDTQLLNLGSIKANDSLSVMLTTPGTYYYQNKLNSTQKGIIKVQ